MRERPTWDTAAKMAEIEATMMCGSDADYEQLPELQAKMCLVINMYVQYLALGRHAGRIRTSNAYFRPAEATSS